MSKTIREIVRDWLREHGYDGLYYEDCGCSVEPDQIMVCGEPSDGCRAGVRRKDCSGCTLLEAGCYANDGPGQPDHSCIGPKKDEEQTEGKRKDDKLCHLRIERVRFDDDA